MITRRDWWIGVGVILLALLAHAAIPRYEYRNHARPGMFTRMDRWTGSAELVTVNSGERGRAEVREWGARALRPLTTFAEELDAVRRQQSP